MRKLVASILAALPLAAGAQSGAAQPPAAAPAAQPAPAKATPPAAPQAAPPPAAPPQYAPPPASYPAYAPPQGGYYVPPQQYPAQAYPPPQGAPPAAQPGQVPPAPGAPPQPGQHPQYAPPPGYAYPPPQSYPPPQYQPYPPPQPMPKQRAPYQRDSWYIGFQLGGGAASVQLRDRAATSSKVGVKGGKYTLKELLGASPTTFDFDFQVGATLTPKLLLGGQLHGFVASAEYDTAAGKNESTFSETSLNLLATFFPWERGFFMRAGVGVASAQATFKTPGLADQKETGSGGTFTAGLGWAWWLGKSFNLSANLDFSGQGYGGDFFKSSSLATLGLGFQWY